MAAVLTSCHLPVLAQNCTRLLPPKGSYDLLSFKVTNDFNCQTPLKYNTDALLASLHIYKKNEKYHFCSIYHRALYGNPLHAFLLENGLLMRGQRPNHHQYDYAM